MHREEDGAVDARVVTLYIRVMVDSTRSVRVRKLREQGTETDLENMTPAERLSMVWPLTLDAWSFKGEALAEPQLPRHAVRVLRRER